MSASHSWREPEPCPERQRWRIEVVDDLGGLPLHPARDANGQRVLKLCRGVPLDESAAMLLSDFFPDMFDQYDPPKGPDHSTE
jgi:hypothetical protein